LIIHPLYVKLQERSPLGLKKKFNITERDMTTSTMGPHEFYTDYLSKSLPVVLRNDAKEMTFYKSIQENMK